MSPEEHCPLPEDFPRSRVNRPVEDILKAEGLMLAPLINGDWICGRASIIYRLEVTSDHYADPSLGTGKTAREAIAAALKKGLGKSSEIWGT